MNDTAKSSSPANSPSIVSTMATKFGMTAQNFEATLRATCVPSNLSREDFARFLLIANRYGLDPVTREIHAMVTRDNKVQAIVGIDGWVRIMNEHQAMDGIEFEDVEDASGNLQAVRCRIYRKDRSRPVEVTEYMSECRRDTDPWKRWGSRMLRHKAAIQCIRYAFGFGSGIMEQDEFDRWQEDRTKDITPKAPARQFKAWEPTGEPETWTEPKTEEPAKLDRTGSAAEEDRELKGEGGAE